MPPVTNNLGFSCRYQSIDHMLSELTTTPLEHILALLNLSPVLEFWTKNAGRYARGKTIWIFVPLRICYLDSGDHPDNS